MTQILQLYDGQDQTPASPKHQAPNRFPAASGIGGRRPKPTPPGSQLVFDVLHEALGAGVFELRLRDVPATIFVDLREVDDERCGG